MSDIFISYKREDQGEAGTLAAALEATGWSVWWDPRLRAGEHFDAVIERELGEAKCVIVLWSSRSIASQYVRDEATYALTLNKLLPVAIDDVTPPFRFQGLHTPRLPEGESRPEDPSFRKLLADIEGLAGPPTVPSPPTEPVVDDPPPPARGTDSGEAPVRPAPPSVASAAGGSSSLLGIATTYGEGFKPTRVSDIYSLKVYVNLLGRAGDADHCAREEIATFLTREGYSAFEIIDRRHNFFRGYYEYSVQFRR